MLRKLSQEYAILYDPLLIEVLQNEAMALIDKAAARFDEYLKKNLEGVR